MQHNKLPNDPLWFKDAIIYEVPVRAFADSNGDGIGEHISRFTPPNGKYVALAVSDYTVVDIRRNSTGRPTNISRHSNRITVFFKNDDYSIAQCILGLDNAPVVISLSN